MSDTLTAFTPVLVRDSRWNYWKPDIYGHARDDGKSVCVGGVWQQCVPYKGNEHLLGTRRAPDSEI